MGLDFGFDKLSKGIWKSINGDREAFRARFYDVWDNDELKNVNNWCGWGNPAQYWFKDGLKYYDDYDGHLLRPITKDDLFAVIHEATIWYTHNVALLPVAINKGYKYINEEDILSSKIDGVEVIDEHNNMVRYDLDHMEGYLYRVEEYVDPWDVNACNHFIREITDIAINFDWDNDVLLYYVSY